VNPGDQQRLREALVAAYNDPPPLPFLADIGLPRAAYPPPALDAVNAWLHVIQQIDAGCPVDFPTLLTHALRAYPRNRVLLELQDRYPPEDADPQPQAPAAPTAEQQPDPYGARPNVQVFFQVRGEEERRTIMAKLADLTPTLRFATNATMLLEFATADVDRVFAVLGPLPLEWTVVPPGEPAYLISHLIAVGPDGRQFRLGDVPAATQIQDVTASVLSAYPSPGGPRRAVTDRVLANGQGERMRPDQSLHDAGVRDGERIRVGYETNAGAVNPTLRIEALTRARNQLLEFTKASDWDLVANAAELATVYEVRFGQTGFAPPPPPAGPVIVTEHQVRIEFGPDFPQSAPTVYWLSPVFHPNIYPNYECDQARAHPQLQGYVCLGELEEGYQPGLDIGDLCLTLLDIAGFRDYSLQVPTGDVVRTAAGLVVAGSGNALDVTAARWVRDNQDSVAAIGGRRLDPPTAEPARRRYRPLIEPFHG
jgi:hypothetical protein